MKIKVKKVNIAQIPDHFQHSLHYGAKSSVNTFHSPVPDVISSAQTDAGGINYSTYNTGAVSQKDSFAASVQTESASTENADHKVLTQESGPSSNHPDAHKRRKKPPFAIGPPQQVSVRLPSQSCATI